ncbi:hypothetical protein R9C00_18540 [Flammeovirgaceae bacterium SG7u.111]|nr:hypothetical protein [Flammeovirgaceae bacterium SG7u.132]WPO33700.1 hypothetical protein R9C00_18540 [Flammeovirgaceae bacterium SG7u.111]
MEDSLRVGQDFIGLKAVIESDTVRGMLYIDYLKGKSQKRRKRKKANQPDVAKPFKPAAYYKFYISGDSCKLGLGF